MKAKWPQAVQHAVSSKVITAKKHSLSSEVDYNKAVDTSHSVQSHQPVSLWLVGGQYPHKYFISPRHFVFVIYKLFLFCLVTPPCPVVVFINVLSEYDSLLIHMQLVCSTVIAYSTCCNLQINFCSVVAVHLSKSYKWVYIRCVCPVSHMPVYTALAVDMPLLALWHIEVLWSTVPSDLVLLNIGFNNGQVVYASLVFFI